MRQKTPILPLIDGDILLWKSTAGAEKPICFEQDTCLPVCSLADAEAAFDTLLSKILHQLKAQDFILCFSDPDHNFRKDLYPAYKSNREGKPKPVAIKPLRDKLLSGDLYPAKSIVMVPCLEADDALGILATHPNYGKGKRKVIVSIDKDFRSVPCELFNFTKPKLGIQHITETDADYWHMLQTLCGDPVDGYSGCPGVGPKRAERLFTTTDKTYQAMWPNVLEVFDKAKLSEAEALTQARLARILRYEDYDFKKKEIRLWNPPKQDEKTLTT